MRIVEDVKLDYSDVLIMPQRADRRSSVSSRSEVSLEREFKFFHSKQTWKGVPIIAANMDTVGTFGAAKVLTKNKMLTSIHKFYTAEEWEDAISEDWYDPKFVIPTFGIRDEDQAKILEIYKIHMKLNKVQFWLCLDVPNGYTETFVEAVSKCRKIFPDLTIIAGNVATPNMAEQLIISGTDLVKIGVGPGSQCFLAGQRVSTIDGEKKIEDLVQGDLVKTHTNCFKKVVNTFSPRHSSEIVSVNNIKCTPEHKFYAVEKKSADKITDENIHELAKWVSAEELNKDIHLLIKSK